MAQKQILVTGASRGIGRAIAERFLSEGHKVLGTFNTGAAEAQDLLAANPNLEMKQVDFADRQDTLRFVSELQGRIFDVLVNNAGMIEFEDFDTFDMSIWDRTFEVNLNTPLVLCTQLAGSLSPKAAIVNVASNDGLIGSFSSMAYSASKAALINLTKSLGNNFGHKGMRVNAVAPGWIDTGMSTEESYDAVQITPLKRNGLPTEVAAAVYFLASDEASFVNGATLLIDGGYSNVDYIMLKEAEAARTN